MAVESQQALHEVNRFRHRAELPMVAAGAVATAVWLLTAIALLLAHQELPGWLSGLVTSVLTLPVMLVFYVRYQFWKTAVDAVEVNEHQYPELYAIFTELSRKIGLSKPPRLYITNGNGVLNAYSAKRTVHKTYVVVYSDLVDTFYELGDQETIRFVLAHELGHIRLGHVNFRRVILASALRIVFLSKTLSRSQEYSADRIGAAMATEGTAARSLSLLYAGKRTYQKMDIDDYIANDTRHISRFWVAIVNFTADHPVGRRRLAAAREMDQHGWDVHGRML
ncbi:M48 family metallopeptidase [Streptomyces sp. NPDC005963]|uniref:M48 family metallopeptidase n=1 Tax=Streptomyces sp. NPDC005963 TaxID=3156721 RepID=UPI00340733E4